MSLRKSHHDEMYKTHNGSESARIQIYTNSKNRNMPADSLSSARFAKTSLGMYKNNIDKKTPKSKPCVSSINKLKSIQKLDRTKSPLIKSSRLEKRNSSINPTELQKTVIKEKITPTTNISSVRYSKHFHPANKRLSESKPAVDSKKSELNNHLSENTQKPQNNLLKTGEYYNKDLAFSKPKTARKKLITDFSIQIPKEDYSPSGQKGSVDLNRNSQTDKSTARSKVKTNMKFSNTLALYKELHEKSIKRQEMFNKGVLRKTNLYESKVTGGCYSYAPKQKEAECKFKK